MGLAGLVLGYITLAGGVIWFLFLGGLAVLGMVAGMVAGAAGY